MPVQPTYPGVYIQEIPSGVRTIAGVSTSITAFVGRTRRGPVGEPLTCFNMGDFNRRFGGLWDERPLTYAVDDFFANGGGQAIVLRLFNEDGDDGTATLAPGGLTLRAASPGTWGDRLSATVTHPEDAAAATAFAASLAARGIPVTAADLFDLTVVDAGTDAREVHRNVTVHADGGPRRIDRVLESASNLVRTEGALPAARPADAATATATGGNDGAVLGEPEFLGDRAQKTGIHGLLKTDIFNLLCIPADARGGTLPPGVWEKAAELCHERRALLVVDPPAAWDANPDTAAQTVKAAQAASGIISLTHASNAALYFPRLRKRDVLRDGQVDAFLPCGAVAGIMARTDVNRGVWKAPAGIEATVSGAEGLTVNMTNEENGLLNPIGVNCLRSFPNIGRVVWGARTLKGHDQLSDDYKYVPVRRLALFIEESLYRGTQWVVFEPNDEPLWAQIRMNVGAFMQRLFRQGAFQGASPRDAYFVKCDAETTTPDDVNRGIVNIVVGFAPLQPAEFVIISIQQIRNAS